MRNIKLTIAYDGTNYRGWQIQPYGSTIQGELEGAIKKVFEKKIRVYGASRTDSGVHAKGQVCNFKTSRIIPTEKIPLALNAVLSEDIAVLRAEEVSPDFHSQFAAKAKCYRYYIFNSRERNPFKERYSWRVPYELNILDMCKEASVLKGRHDFKSFQARDKKERDAVRRIFKINIKMEKTSVLVDIWGDGFLYNMARNIVGTLVEIGRGYLPLESMRKILASKDRTQAGPTAPAKGLFLMEVRF